MSRVSIIEQLYAPKKKTALEFKYDSLYAPPIRFLLTQQDINQLYKIATSLRYNDDIEKKYELIDAVMRPRGFRRGNCGTNRVVYNFLEDPTFCMKIALDKVGLKDSPAEFKNQEFFKPFCCKIFEVDPTGVIACVERVNPISSLEEFASIADDIFNMMITKIIGKYVVDDLGSEKFMNYGIRYNSNGVAFGPVVIDFPYAYELDGAKLKCANRLQFGNRYIICNGDIDYDEGLNNLRCDKCGKIYTAQELSKDDSNVIKFYNDEEGVKRIMRVQIVRKDGTVVKDCGRSSSTYITETEYEMGNAQMDFSNSSGYRKVSKKIFEKKTRMTAHDYREKIDIENVQQQNNELFNPVIDPEQFNTRKATTAKINDAESINSEKIEIEIIHDIEEREETDLKDLENNNDGATIKDESAMSNNENTHTITDVISDDLEKQVFPEITNNKNIYKKRKVIFSNEYDDEDDFYRKKGDKRNKRNKKNKRIKGMEEY